MALAIDSTSLINLGSLAVDDYPFTLTGWFRVPINSELMTLMRVSNTTTGSYHGLHYEGHNANQVAAISRDSNTSAARSTAPMIPGEWHHVVGIFESSTSRRVYLDGGNQSGASHQRLFDGANDFSLGNLISSTAIDAAEVAVIGTVLSDSDIQVLAAGISPLVVSELQSFLCYHDCLRRINRPGLGPLATSAGAAVVLPHPRVFVPRGGHSAIQPCRFAGPYALDHEAMQTSVAERAQTYIPGIEAHGGEVFAA